MVDSFTMLKERLLGRKLVIYGIDCNVFELLTIIENAGDIPVSFFVDKKSNIVNSAFGREVKNYKYLSPKRHYCVISPIHFYNEIAEKLVEIGFKENDDYCSSIGFKSIPVTIDGVTVGKHSVGWSTYMSCLGRSTANCIESIGSFCSINKTSQINTDHNFLLTTSSEIFGLQSSHKYTDKPNNQIIIGSDVWIGANTFINASKAKSIGHGAVIGSGAVVIEDVPPYSIVVGVPAKVKKYRFTIDQIDILMQVKWWEWSDEKIAENLDLFYNYDLFFDKYK